MHRIVWLALLLPWAVWGQADMEPRLNANENSVVNLQGRIDVIEVGQGIQDTRISGLEGSVAGIEDALPAPNAPLLDNAGNFLGEVVGIYPDRVGQHRVIVKNTYLGRTVYTYTEGGPKQFSLYPVNNSMEDAGFGQQRLAYLDSCTNPTIVGAAPGVPSTEIRIRDPLSEPLIYHVYIANNDHAATEQTLSAVVDIQGTCRDVQPYTFVAWPLLFVKDQVLVVGGTVFDRGGPNGYSTFGNGPGPVFEELPPPPPPVCDPVTGVNCSIAISANGTQYDLNPVQELSNGVPQYGFLTPSIPGGNGFFIGIPANSADDRANLIIGGTANLTYTVSGEFSPVLVDDCDNPTMEMVNPGDVATSRLVVNNGNFYRLADPSNNEIPESTIDVTGKTVGFINPLTIGSTEPYCTVRTDLTGFYDTYPLSLKFNILEGNHDSPWTYQ